MAMTLPLTALEWERRYDGNHDYAVDRRAAAYRLRNAALDRAGDVFAVPTARSDYKAWRARRLAAGGGKVETRQCAHCSAAFNAFLSVKQRFCSPNCHHADLTTRYTDLATRFWQKVLKTPECWEWTGARCRGGYGNIQGPPPAYKTLTASRCSWELHFGPIPKGLHVLHKCDNRGCVNPDHLFLGTTTDNMRDAKAKGRLIPPPLFETHTRAKLTKEQVREICNATGTLAAIARLYGVSRSTIHRIKHGKAWRNNL